MSTYCSPIVHQFKVDRNSNTGMFINIFEPPLSMSPDCIAQKCIVMLSFAVVISEPVPKDAAQNGTFRIEIQTQRCTSFVGDNTREMNLHATHQETLIHSHLGLLSHSRLILCLEE